MNRGKKLILPILSALCVVSLTIMVFALLSDRKEEPAFIPPEFDAAAQKGDPSPQEDLGWSLISQDGLGYSAGICGKIKLKDDSADVFFTNPKENSVWLKLRVMDENGVVIAETGLIKPGEYIRSINFERTPAEVEKIKMKIMSYEPETYYSEGSVILNTRIYIGD